MFREKCRLLSCVILVICLLMCLTAGVSEEGKLSLPAEEMAIIANSIAEAMEKL